MSKTELGSSVVATVEPALLMPLMKAYADSLELRE